jgi:hypothetical protein
MNKRTIADKRIQLAFRVSEREHKRIQSQCISREVSMQDLILHALKFYFQTPPSDWATADIAFMTVTDDETGTKNEQTEWLMLWTKYTNKMPREKVLLMAEVMKMDLQLLKSSRRKTAAKN